MARVLMVLAAFGFVAACGGPTTTATGIGPRGEVRQIVLRTCDDGGDGGVLIGGVCL